MKILLGKLPGGNWSYISFFRSPSKPPKVSVGLEGVKNHTDPDRMEYHIQAGNSGMYFTSQCQVSQCRSLYQASATQLVFFVDANGTALDFERAVTCELC